MIKEEYNDDNIFHSYMTSASVSSHHSNYTQMNNDGRMFHDLPTTSATTTTSISDAHLNEFAAPGAHNGTGVAEDDDILMWLLQGGLGTIVPSNDNSKLSSKDQQHLSKEESIRSSNNNNLSSGMSSTIGSSNVNSSSSSIGAANSGAVADIDDDAQFTWVDALIDNVIPMASSSAAPEEGRHYTPSYINFVDNEYLDADADDDDEDDDDEEEEDDDNFTMHQQYSSQGNTTYGSSSSLQGSHNIHHGYHQHHASQVSTSNSQGAKSELKTSLNPFGSFYELLHSTPSNNHLSNESRQHRYQDASSNAFSSNSNDYDLLFMQNENNYKGNGLRKKGRKSSIANGQSFSSQFDPLKTDGADEVQLSPKSLAQREKNRQAVRNCRKRKRDYEMDLRNRYKRLQDENALLKSQVRFQNDVEQSKSEKEERNLLTFLHACIGPAVEDASSTNVKAMTNATENYINHVAMTAREREAAIDFLLTRLERDMMPIAVTKMFLWLASQENIFFEQTTGMWDDVVKHLKLTSDQVEKIRTRMVHLLRTSRIELENSFVMLRRLRAILLDSKKLGFEPELLATMSQVLTPVQFAMFLCNLNTKAEEILNWDEFINSFLTDAQVYFEANNRAAVSALSNHIPPAANNLSSSGVLFDPNLANAMATSGIPSLRFGGGFEDLSSIEQARLLRQARIATANGLAELFINPTTGLEELKMISKRLVVDDIVVFDPNTVGESRGILPFVIFTRRLKLAFETGTLNLIELKMYGDKGRAKWRLEGIISSRYHNIIRNHGTISYETICHFHFKKNSSLVKEIDITWDPMALMVEFGLIDKSMLPTKQTNNSKPQGTSLISDDTDVKLENGLGPFSQGSPMSLSSQEIEDLRGRACEDLRKMFECDDDSLIGYLARRSLAYSCVFLDSNMVSEFNGLTQCISYIKRVRKPFPRFLVDTQKVEVERIGPDDPTQPKHIIEVKWACSCLYGGALVKNPCPCSFQVTLLVSFSTTTNQIDTVRFSWDARTLFAALGVTSEVPSKANAPLTPAHPSQQ